MKNIQNDLNNSLNNNSLNNNNSNFNDSTKLSNENFSLKNDIEHYKHVINKLQFTIEDYSNELNKKNRIINENNFNLSQIEDKNLKLKNDNDYLLTIIIRLSKLFSNNNLLEIIHKEIDHNNLDVNQKNEINNMLLCELQRIEDCFRIMKENSKYW